MSLKLGICVWCIPVQEAEESVHWAAEVGLQGIELDLGDDKNDYALAKPEVRKQYAEWGSQWSIIYPSLGVNDLCKYGMSVPAHRRMAQSALEKAVTAAADLNIPLLQLPSFVNGDITSAEGFKSTVECLRYVCQFARGTDILVGSENALSAEEQLRLIEEVGYSNFRIYFDTRNPFANHRYDSAAQLERLLPYVAEIHLKDGIDNGKSVLLGEGNSGFMRSLDVIKKRAYGGWLVLENNYQAIASEASADPRDGVRKDIELVRSSLAQ